MASKLISKISVLIKVLERWINLDTYSLTPKTTGNYFRKIAMVDYKGYGSFKTGSCHTGLLLGLPSLHTIALAKALQITKRALIPDETWWRHQMETFSALLASGQRHRALIFSAPEHTVEWTIVTSMIWDAIALIVTSLLWIIRSDWIHGCNTMPSTPGEDHWIQH